MTEKQGAYGDRMRAYLGVKEVRAITMSTPRKSVLAATRIKCDRPDFLLSVPIPGEKSYIVAHHLDNLVCRCGDTVSCLDLAASPQLSLQSPWDIVQFYIPQAALDEVANAFLAPRGRLAWPSAGRIADPVITGLGASLLPMLESRRQAPQIIVDHIGFALLVHLAHVYGGISPRQSSSGGLAPWQERRAKALIDAHLDGGIALAEIACECRLSPKYFTRAFKQTTGLPPYRWLLARRIEVAQDLLRRSGLSLSEIALATGFADQSAFTRTFTRFVGISPGAWRRLHHG